MLFPLWASLKQVWTSVTAPPRHIFTDSCKIIRLWGDEHHSKRQFESVSHGSTSTQSTRLVDASTGCTFSIITNIKTHTVCIRLTPQSCKDGWCRVPSLDACTGPCATLLLWHGTAQHGTTRITGEARSGCAAPDPCVVPTLTDTSSLEAAQRQLRYSTTYEHTLSSHTRILEHSTYTQC